MKTSPMISAAEARRLLGVSRTLFEKIRGELRDLGGDRYFIRGENGYLPQ